MASVICIWMDVTEEKTTSHIMCYSNDQYHNLHHMESEIKFKERAGEISEKSKYESRIQQYSILIKEYYKIIARNNLGGSRGDYNDIAE